MTVLQYTVQMLCHAFSLEIIITDCANECFSNPQVMVQTPVVQEECIFIWSSLSYACNGIECKCHATCMLQCKCHATCRKINPLSEKLKSWEGCFPWSHQVKAFIYFFYFFVTYKIKTALHFRQLPCSLWILKINISLFNWRLDKPKCWVSKTCHLH